MTHSERITFFQEKDPKIAQIIQAIGDIAPYHHKDLFDALISSLISQQLSTKAAATIYCRFKAYFNDILEPGVLLNTSTEELRSLGISRQKSGYIHDVCHHFTTRPELFTGLEALNDEAIIEQLISIRGVGRWTAEMILMFTLKRQDVFPIDDLGIQQSMKTVYELEEKPKNTILLEIAENWRPMRSWACFYLWRHRDLKA